MYINMDWIQSRQGWCAVLCLFTTWFLWHFLIKGLGVMLPTLQEHFSTKTWLIGWMVSIISGVICLSGVLARPLEVVFGTRTVVTVGGFLLGAGMIVASFTPSVTTLTLAIALTAGSSLSIVNILTRAMIGRCFTTNYATATGIGTSGAAFGLIAAGPIMQLLLDTYGWRGALFLVGGFNLHLSVCGSLLKSRATETQTNGSYQSLGPVEDEEPPARSGVEDTGNLKQPRPSALKDAISAQLNHFGVSVCCHVSFWITTTLFICNVFVNDLWTIYFISLAQVKGFSPYDAVTFSSVAGITNVIFKVVCGLIVDRGWFKLRPTIVLMTASSSLSLLITPWLTSFWSMMASAVVFVSASGTLYSLNDIYTRELLGVDLLACAFSWMNLMTAVFDFGLGFFPGWLFDCTGSYDWAFVIIGCIAAVPLVGLFIERFLVKPSESGKVT
ncbi:monocarboxylate transporter 13-like isoform X2 [Acanthaster planci]|uniref:Monocarboxylate transporter 13-like isoform X2 n=1 Tax=Acanthaster planci TaxID=133434 RepID=A0A8B7ZH25_ACAPL|nr:monocarboxylate transporter 13-like isoform X2 [Acanthaster planci]